MQNTESLISNFAYHLKILARANVRITQQRLLSLLKSSKLMVLTIISFIIGYVTIGYLMFKGGLGYIENFPGLGPILSERIYYLLFFFIFLMLIFSNAAIGYAALYRSKETRWLHSLPISNQSIYFWKFIETMILSSWGFIIISAPLLCAYGTIKSAPITFYIGAGLASLPFVIIPASIAGLIVVLSVRYFKRWFSVFLIAGFIYGVTAISISLMSPPVEPPPLKNSIFNTVNHVLRHTELSVNPFIPSTWMSNALAGWTRPFDSNALQYAMLMASYAGIGLWITLYITWRFYHSGLSLSMRRNAHSSWRKRSKKGTNRINPIRIKSRKVSFLHKLKPKLAYSALAQKDLLTFRRDPAQWIQVTVVFSLLFLYVLNVRNMGIDYQTPFWIEIISLLNLGVCSLALSTLTTRFVFPQFSLEGKRLWILSMCPIPIEQILIQKLVTSCCITGSITAILMFLSSALLKMSIELTMLYSIAIILICVGLNSIAISLGTIFPNERETNPAKIVSGFGGTLCLIVSFLYILSIIAFLTFPVAVKLSKKGILSTYSEGISTVIALIFSLALTIIISFIPLKIALKKTGDLRYLRNL
ncbi:MAG: hypothetical protein HN584_03130 [Akkermansiaceae bacterium]|jgi:ABC-2 type transport system permease protein|nr:hypothetical protein [Akkermansiaceae bacterium]